MKQWLVSRLLPILLIQVAIVGNGRILAYDKTYTVYMIGNSHIDAAWRWRTLSAIKACRNTFDTMVLLLDLNPDWTGNHVPHIGSRPCGQNP